MLRRVRRDRADPGPHPRQAIRLLVAPTQPHRLLDRRPTQRTAVLAHHTRRPTVASRAASEGRCRDRRRVAAVTGQTYEARDPRWTDQTQDLVADLLYRRNGDSHVDACRVLDALAATGLLLPPSGYTREVFEVRTRGVRWPCDTEEAA